MCGFLGRAGRSPLDDAEIKRLEAGLATLAHRGPNESRTSVTRTSFLGFRRLSILDLSTAGGQPQHRGDWQVVFNGEVYNFAALRRQLEDAGTTFQSKGDAEVVAAWIAAYGAAGLADLEGMFAIAAVHKTTGDVLLARDRFGIKPLYYGLFDGTLMFASEPRAILAACVERPRLDEESIARYFAIGLCWGEATPYAGIQRLAPGCYLRWQQGTRVLEQTRWYRWPPNAVVQPVDDAALSDAIERAVSSHLVSDVPLGVYLSGGIDSGLVASYAVAAAKANGRSSPQLLTVSFPGDASRNEAEVAARVAKHLGAEHQVVAMGPEAQGLNLQALAEAYDEPFADSSAIPTLLLNQVASQHATVWLSGDGGDEGFLGYRHHATALKWLPHPWRRRIWLQRLLFGVRKFFPSFSWTRYALEKFTLPAPWGSLGYWVLPKDPALLRVLTTDAWDTMNQALEPVRTFLEGLEALPLDQRLRAVDFNFFLAADGLVKMDRAAMHYSVEVRVPMLDPGVVALAAAWPATDLRSGGQGKAPLRRLAAARLPQGVAGLRKQGFGVPLKQVFTKEHERQIVAQAEASPLVRSWIQPTGFQAMLKAWRSGHGRNFDEVVWRTVAFVLWAERWGKKN